MSNGHTPDCVGCSDCFNNGFMSSFTSCSFFIRDGKSPQIPSIWNKCSWLSAIVPGEKETTKLLESSFLNSLSCSLCIILSDNCCGLLESLSVRGWPGEKYIELLSQRSPLRSTTSGVMLSSPGFDICSVVFWPLSSGNITICDSLSLHCSLVKSFDQVIPTFSALFFSDMSSFWGFGDTLRDCLARASISNVVGGWIKLPHFSLAYVKSSLVSCRVSEMGSLKSSWFPCSE